MTTTIEIHWPSPESPAIIGELRNGEKLPEFEPSPNAKADPQVLRAERKQWFIGIVEAFPTHHVGGQGECYVFSRPSGAGMVIIPLRAITSYVEQP